jgi:hypothetical protein
MTRSNRKIHEKPGMCHIRVRNAEQSLSFCHLTQQRFINVLVDGVHERYGWYNEPSPDYRPKLRVFTEKAYICSDHAPVQDADGETDGLRSVYPPT